MRKDTWPSRRSSVADWTQDIDCHYSQALYRGLPTALHGSLQAGYESGLREKQSAAGIFQFIGVHRRHPRCQQSVSAHAYYVVEMVG